MRRDGQQHLALGQRLSHQTKFIIFEVAQSAVDQLAAGRGGCAGKIVLLDKQHRQAASCGVACDTGAVDAAANDDKVVLIHAGPVPDRKARTSKAKKVRRSTFALGRSCLLFVPRCYRVPVRHTALYAFPAVGRRAQCLGKALGPAWPVPT